MTSASPKQKALEVLEQIKNVQEVFLKNEPGSREQLLNLSYALSSALELPSETIQRIGWAEPARTAQCKVGVDVGLFERLGQPGTGGKSTDQLAEECGVEESLMSRMLKHLAAMSIVHEVSADTYGSTTFTEALTEPKFRDGITYINDIPGPSFKQLPSYLKSTSYRTPTSLTDGPFQSAHATKLPFFGWLHSNPPYLGIFSNYMGAYRAGRASWVDAGFYPVSERLASAFEPSTSPVLLVDVGGGQGHDLQELCAKHANLPGTLILQDQADVVAKVSAQGFEAVPHDFFGPQPVKHARAYYLHSVLHDWSDDDCVKILTQIVPAMKRGYSKVLLNEIAVPERGAGWPVTSMDWLMMALGAMRERSMREWEAILGRAGLKVSKVFTYEMSAESLIEAELA